MGLTIHGNVVIIRLLVIKYFNSVKGKPDSLLFNKQLPYSNWIFKK